MQTINILEFLLHELRMIKPEYKEFKKGYIQAIKDFMTAYEDNN